MSRDCDVLHRVHVPDRIVGPKVEGSQVHRVVRAVIASMERDAEKTLLEDVAASNVQFNRALGEIAAFNPRDAISLAL